METEIEFYKALFDEHDIFIKWMKKRIAWGLGFATAFGIFWPFVAHRIGEALGLFQK